MIQEKEYILNESETKIYKNHKKLTFNKQRWSLRGRPWPRGRPRGHILKSLASKVKSLALASKPQVLENCPVLGSRTALFFKQLKFRSKTPETSRKICERFFVFLTWSIGVAKEGVAGGTPPSQLKFHQ